MAPGTSCPFPLEQRAQAWKEYWTLKTRGWPAHWEAPSYQQALPNKAGKVSSLAGRDGEIFVIHRWKYGPPSSSTRLSRELVRKAASQTLPHTYWIRKCILTNMCASDTHWKFGSSYLNHLTFYTGRNQNPEGWRHSGKLTGQILEVNLIL